MKNEPKLFLQKLKLYFSTLFARSMTKAIFGAPDLKDNEILFTNIDLIEAELYTPDPEYFIHRVTLKDDDFVEDLFEVFPLLKNGIVLLYTDKFFSAINKNTGDLCDIKLVNKESKVLLSAKLDEATVETECGEIISSYQATRYLDIMQSGSINKSTSVSTKLNNRISLEDKLTILDLGKLFNDLDGDYTCALLNNQSTISVKEFIKKANVTNYTHSVMSVREGDAARLNVWFSCPLVDVVSVQPAVVWFPKQTKSPITI